MIPRYWLQLLISSASALTSLHTYGSKFYDTDGKQFFIKGVAYQPSVQNESTTAVIDPLANGNIESCRRNVKLLSDIGANVIRVYAIDASQNHDLCMQALADAGIYLFLDLANPATAINRASPTWNTIQFAEYASVIDAFSSYPNTAGYFAGNEVANTLGNINAMPYVKAAVRDSKAYMKARGLRQIPVGYAGADVIDVRQGIMDYLACGDSSERVDFFGLNIYGEYETQRLSNR